MIRVRGLGFGGEEEEEIERSVVRVLGFYLIQ